MSLIAVRSRKAVKLFERLLDQFRSQQNTTSYDVSDVQVLDNFGRFRIWAGNIGALQNVDLLSSLDYRLRDAPRVSSQLCETLDDLLEALDDACSILSDSRENRTANISRKIVADPEQRHGEDNDSGGDDNDSFGQGSDSEELSEIKEIFKTIEDALHSLFRISIIIRNNTKRDRYAKAMSAATRSPFNEQFDISHVDHRFPALRSKGRPWLVERLGKAITQRRQFLRYCREHHDKTARDSEERPMETESSHKHTLHGPAKLLPSSMSELSRPASTQAPTQASTLVLVAGTVLDEDVIEENLSQTSYATSMDEESDSKKLSVISLEDVREGSKHFECPYCWQIQALRAQKSWKKHVFSDLKPYVCTFEECELKLFSDRHTWFSHESNSHRQHYRCHFCKYGTFDTSVRYHNHLIESHGNAFTDDQLPALMEMSQQAISRIPPAECPFCDDWEEKLRKINQNVMGELVVTPNQFQHHVGAHMEQLALFAVPRGSTEISEADSGRAAWPSDSVAPSLDSIPSVPSQTEQLRACEQIVTEIKRSGWLCPPWAMLPAQSFMVSNVGLINISDRLDFGKILQKLQTGIYRNSTDFWLDMIVMFALLRSVGIQTDDPPELVEGKFSMLWEQYCLDEPHFSASELIEKIAPRLTWRLWKAMSLSAEPKVGQDTLKVTVRMLDNKPHTRIFKKSDDLEDLYAYLECHEFIGYGPYKLQEPSDYTQACDFRLMPVADSLSITVHSSNPRNKLGYLFGNYASLVMQRLGPTEEPFIIGLSRSEKTQSSDIVEVTTEFFVSDVLESALDQFFHSFGYQSQLSVSYITIPRTIDMVTNAVSCGGRFCACIESITVRAESFQLSLQVMQSDFRQDLELLVNVVREIAASPNPKVTAAHNERFRLHVESCQAKIVECLATSKQALERYGDFIFNFGKHTLELVVTPDILDANIPLFSLGSTSDPYSLRVPGPSAALNEPEALDGDHLGQEHIPSSENVTLKPLKQVQSSDVAQRSHDDEDFLGMLHVFVNRAISIDGADGIQRLAENTKKYGSFCRLAIGSYTQSTSPYTGANWCYPTWGENFWFDIYEEDVSRDSQLEITVVGFDLNGVDTSLGSTSINLRQVISSGAVGNDSWHFLEGSSARIRARTMFHDKKDAKLIDSKTGTNSNTGTEALESELKPATEYVAYTISKDPTPGSKQLSWAECEAIRDDSMDEKTILKRIEELDGGRQTLEEKQLSLAELPRTQIISVLRILNETSKPVGARQWTLVQLERIAKPTRSPRSKKHQTALKVYLKRARLQGVDSTTSSPPSLSDTTPLSFPTLVDDDTSRTEWINDEDSIGDFYDEPQPLEDKHSVKSDKRWTVAQIESWLKKREYAQELQSTIQFLGMDTSRTFIIHPETGTHISYDEDPTHFLDVFLEQLQKECSRSAKDENVMIKLRAAVEGQYDPEDDQETWPKRFNISDFDLTAMVKAIQSPAELGGVSMKTRRWEGHIYENTFLGSEMVTWLLENFSEITNRGEAIDFGNSLTVGSYTLFVHVGNRHQFRDGEFFYQIALQFCEKIENASDMEKSPTTERTVSVDSVSEYMKWTVNVMLVPFIKYPVVFHRNTVAYKRCVSRGLQRILVIHGVDDNAFRSAVVSSFGELLEGRQWNILVYQDRALHMPSANLANERYTPEFLQKHCALNDADDLMLEIYITPIDGMSWEDVRKIKTSKTRLNPPIVDDCWEYDAELDGPVIETHHNKVLENEISAIVAKYGANFKRLDTELRPSVTHTRGFYYYDCFDVTVRTDDGSMAITTTFEVPPDYPNSPPRIQTLGAQGLSLTDKIKVDAQIQKGHENLSGKPMILTILLDCKATLEELSVTARDKTKRTPPWQGPPVNEDDYKLPCEFGESMGCEVEFSPLKWEEWIAHSFTHFLSCDPPDRGQCGFCIRTLPGNGNPHESWRWRMIHMGKHHYNHDVRKEPDYHLNDYLKSHSLIGGKSVDRSMKIGKASAESAAIVDAMTAMSIETKAHIGARDLQDHQQHLSRGPVTSTEEERQRSLLRSCPLCENCYKDDDVMDDYICGHKAHRGCAEAWVAKEGKDAEGLGCPECRRDRDGRPRLPTLSMMQSLV